LAHAFCQGHAHHLHAHTALMRSHKPLTRSSRADQRMVVRLQAYEYISQAATCLVCVSTISYPCNNVVNNLNMLITCLSQPVYLRHPRFRHSWSSLRSYGTASYEELVHACAQACGALARLCVQTKLALLPAVVPDMSPRA
jgi:hypothetical protein